MTVASTQPAFSAVRFHVGLHACRTQQELEAHLVQGLAQLAPGVDAALCLRIDEGEGALEVRAVAGPSCPLKVAQRVARGAWDLPDHQRLEVAFESHALGELWLGAPLSPQLEERLRETAAHVGTALVNLALNSEARAATDEYCGTLQALEEGIVLFQEPDRDALTARVLALAGGVVDATAGALYVFEEVGNASSQLLLEQAFGMPDTLLASFRGAAATPWPESLNEGAVHVAERDRDGSIAGLPRGVAPAVLERIVSVPLRYHGVHAGVCVLFNPRQDVSRELIGRLQSFGTLAAALLHRLSLERIRQSSVSIERELEIAETIQRRLVPDEAPPCAAFEFAWHSQAAKRIGGDYVDFVVSKGAPVQAVVADASGHGINSALLMGSFRANYRATASLLEVGELAAALNEAVVHEVGPTGMFITAAMLRIDPASRTIRLCSAGHSPALVYRAHTQTVEVVPSHGTPFGFLSGARYEHADVVLASGDAVVLYTDGVTEAANAEQQMFGDQRLRDLVARHGATGAQALSDAILSAVAVFTGTAQHEDDLSLMIIRARS